MNKPSPSPMPDIIKRYRKIDQTYTRSIECEMNKLFMEEHGTTSILPTGIIAYMLATEQTRTPGSDGVGAPRYATQHMIDAGRNALAVLQKNSYGVACDIVWTKMWEAYDDAQAPTPEPVGVDITLCEGCRCDGKKTEAIHFGDDEDVGFCTPCWGIYTRDCKIEELEAALKAALSQTKKE